MSERSGVRSPASAWIFYFAASSWLFFFAIVSTFCAIYLAPYIPFYSYSRELERRGLFHSYFMLPHRESRRGESKEFRESLAMGNLSSSSEPSCTTQDVNLARRNHTHQHSYNTRFQPNRISATHTPESNGLNTE